MSKRKETITDTKKPFDENLNKDLLFNIQTWIKANVEAEQYLLNKFNKAIKTRDSFISEYKNDPEIFESSIIKTKMVNFVKGNVMKKNKSKKVAEVISIKKNRDIFGNLFFPCCYTQYTNGKGT